jgi:hypothetical protein
MKKQVLYSTAAAAAMMFATGSLYASPTNGTFATQTSVSANGVDKYNSMSFFAGEPAEVMIQGNGKTSLWLSVYDRSGNLVAQDVCQLEACAVRWEPKTTDDFKVVVENLGSVYNAYKVIID